MYRLFAVIVLSLAFSSLLPAQAVDFTSYTVPTFNAEPFGITAGPDGALWFTEQTGNKIGRISAAGEITEYPVPDGFLVGITAGPDGALWFGDAANLKVGRITTTGTVTEYPVPSVNAITAGPDGALWFTEYQELTIGRISTSGAVTEYPIASANPFLSPSLNAIAAGPDGALWFTDGANKAVGRITTSGVITEYSVPNASGSMEGIVAGPDGALWFADELSQFVGRITTAGVVTEYSTSLGSMQSARPSGITVGPNGMLWFCDYGGATIGSVSTSGAVTLYSVPNPGSGALFLQIALGPDGALWFTNFYPNTIERAATASPVSAPVISGLSPDSITAGGPAFTLTVNGSGFNSGATVEWNGGALATTYVNVNQLTAAAPANLIASPGSASVHVANSGGTTSNALLFTINAPTASVSSLSPVSVTAGGPGFSLTVNGSGFLPASAVEWNGASLATSYLSATQLSASVGATLIASAGTASISVSSGGTTSNAVLFTINVATPSISSLSPASATAGGPGFTLMVIGSGFLPASAVEWNGAPLVTSYVSATLLSASVGASLIGSAGTASVSVSSSGTTSNALIFTINAATPSVSSLSPASATAGGPGFSLTVNGSGFLPASAVEWNGASLATSYVSATQLSASVGATLIGSAGTASVSVSSSGTTSNAVLFTINAAMPSISSLSPASATAGGPAFSLMVNGSGFLPASAVEWNGAPLATSYVSATQLSASVGATLIGSAGTASVTVLNPGGAVSSTMTFTIDSTQAGAFTITTAPLLPDGTVGVPYSQTLAATGGVSPYKSWTVIAGGLPPGITLTRSSGALTGLLSGTPASAGQFAFTVQATDNANTNATEQFSMTIHGGGVSISAAGIVNAASYAGGAVAPGEIVTIFGAGLGPGTLAGLELDSRGYVSASPLAGTQVLFDAVAAPLIYSWAGQVSVVVPYEVSGKSATQVQVVYQGQLSNLVSMPVSEVMPAIFTIDTSGSGPGAIVNQDGTVNSASHPAPVGSFVSVYGTGEGQTTPSGIDGKPGASPAPVPLAHPVTATVGGLSAEVQYAGGAPGLVAGVIQVNVQIPQGVAAGSSVPIAIEIAGQKSQSNVTLAIK